jgi:hypothetical protein
MRSSPSMLLTMGGQKVRQRVDHKTAPHRNPPSGAS